MHEWSKYVCVLCIFFQFYLYVFPESQIEVIGRPSNTTGQLILLVRSWFNRIDWALVVGMCD